MGASLPRGGGAIQISSARTLRVGGTIRSSGAPGATPCGGSDEGGGTGGGSGGAILIEGSTVDTAGSTLQASGGPGGANGTYVGIFNCGGKAGGAGSTSASAPGGDGLDCEGGSPGGGDTPSMVPDQLRARNFAIASFTTSG